MMEIVAIQGVMAVNKDDLSPILDPDAEALALKLEAYMRSKKGDLLQPIKLIGKKPLFGICLGHQILALALGGKTYKLKFGHRGCNHPVKNLENNTIEITSQNHGFSVDEKSLSKNIKITHTSLNDNTVEGLSCQELSLFSVQYHPESSPGPHDSQYLFKKFIEMMKKNN